MVTLKTAMDDSGASDEAVKNVLSAEGPPFLFGSNEPMAVGEGFMFLDNAWIVTRSITREEFIDNAGRPRKLNPVGVDNFFEAVTE